MNLILVVILVVLLSIWSLVLTVLHIRFQLKLRKILKGSKKDTIVDILNDILGREEKIEKRLGGLDKEVEGLIFDSKFYIQKIGLIRFNPFNDTGGDQSFILALVNSEDSGVVVSGLHTRNGTRWYAKKVEHGKGVEHELSEDEVKAIKSATKKLKNNG
jgi:hypothetical protein